MAIDESLLNSRWISSSPVLRFYTWQAPTLSLGRFQDYKKVVCEPFCVHNNIDVVRRITGGRAVLHDAEVTYAVVAPLDQGIFKGRSLRETYRDIAAAWNLALHEKGVDRADIAMRGEAQHPRASEPQCFVSVSQYEISERSRKIIGSAQVRRSDRFLQHGSILLDFDSRLQAGCVSRHDPEIERKIAPLNRLLKRSLTFDEIARDFASAFESTVGIRLEPAELDPSELQGVSDLENIYLAEEWTRSGCR